MLNASMIILGAIKIGKGSTALNTNDITHTSPRPTSPPMMHKKALSIKNSVRMVLFLAPNAFFSPIWLVLSRTVTNMILATPKAPTIRLNPAIAHPPALTWPKKPFTCSLNWATSLQEKLSSSVGLSRLDWRITPTNSSCKAADGMEALP